MSTRSLGDALKDLCGFLCFQLQNEGHRGIAEPSTGDALRGFCNNLGENWPVSVKLATSASWTASGMKNFLFTPLVLLAGGIIKGHKAA